MFYTVYNIMIVIKHQDSIKSLSSLSELKMHYKLYFQSQASAIRVACLLADPFIVISSIFQWKLSVNSELQENLLTDYWCQKLANTHKKIKRLSKNESRLWALVLINV